LYPWRFHSHACKDEFWTFQHFLSEPFVVNRWVLYYQCVLVKIKFKKLIIINTTLRGAKVLHQCHNTKLYTTVTRRGIARILHWGPQKLSAEGARIKENRGEWGLGRGCGRQHIFGIFEAHRTLLVEKTLLLY